MLQNMSKQNATKYYIPVFCEEKTAKVKRQSTRV